MKKKKSDFIKFILFYLNKLSSFLSIDPLSRPLHIQKDKKNSNIDSIIDLETLGAIKKHPITFRSINGLWYFPKRDKDGYCAYWMEFLLSDETILEYENVINWALNQDRESFLKMTSEENCLWTISSIWKARYRELTKKNFNS